MVQFNAGHFWIGEHISTSTAAAEAWTPQPNRSISFLAQAMFGKT
jgi:hypothetical protein